jgi:hypothetical protein
MVQLVLKSELQPLGLRAVAWVMAWHANEATGHVWASLGTIADEAGVSRDRVKQVVRLLVDQAVVEVVARGSGGHYKGTTTYAFCAAWVGKQETRVSSLPGKPTTRERALPGNEASRDPGTREPLPGNERSPNIDERKAKPSLSSKTAREATAPGRVHPPDAAPVRLNAVNAKTNSQQPPTGNAPPLVLPDLSWMGERDTIEAKGIALGVGGAAPYLAKGKTWDEYRAAVIWAASQAGQFRARGRAA